jgi:DNA processing protein
MVDVSSFWVGASLADAGAALAAFVEARGIEGSWREALEGCTVHDVAATPGVRLSPKQRARWAEASSCLTVQPPLFRGSPGYPARLSRVRDAPPILFVQGDPQALEAEVAVAIVGTRSCSPYGAGLAQRFAHGVAASGGVVVSGLARGIDAHAHRAAARVGRTVAVLGHGLGFMSPRSNEGLRRELLARGGCVVSSWPDTVPPARHTFPRRNRWIAGLSDAVLVAQAGARSGAGITARDALGIGIDVWAVPGPLGEGFEGCAALMNQGARAVHDVDDVLVQLTGRAPQGVSDWFRALLHGASIDRLARLRGTSVADTLVELGRLEAAGVVVRRPGGRYAPGEQKVCHADVHEAHREGRPVDPAR